MATPYLGELRVFSFGFAPRGWATCNGQLLPINQNQALFAILGTTFGGDGTTTFALPNLQGRVPIHASTTTSTDQYATGAPTTTLNPDAIASTGSGKAHENRPPTLGLNICIALVGIFPSRS